MPIDSVFVDFLEKIGMGFGATLAVLAVVGLSIPGRAKVSRSSEHDHQAH